MNFQQTELEKPQNLISEPLAGYKCIEQHDQDGGGGIRPRCLASLPSNIEDLISQFKRQESALP